MKSSVLALTSAISALVALTGCSPMTTTSVSHAAAGQKVESAEGVAKLKVVKCATPQLVISLSPLQCKTPACQESSQMSGGLGALVNLAREQEGIPNLAGFGDGMTNMLTSALSATGCFDLLDRELMAELAQEQKLAGREVTLRGSDALATGAITSLSYDKSKSALGGGFVPVIGGISSSKVSAKIGMDVRVVDVSTGRVSYTQTYQAESGKRSFGMLGGGLIGGGLLGGGHSVKGGVEMEEAAREIIYTATVDMVEKMVPAGNYTVEYQ